MQDYTPNDFTAFTRIPNTLLDIALPKLGYAELKIILVIIRKTIGWNKRRDQISLSQFEELTGLTRRNVSRAIVRLRDAGLIRQYRVGQKSYFEVNIDAGIDASVEEIPDTASITKIPVLVSQGIQSSITGDTVLVSLRPPQKKERKKKEMKNSAVADAPAAPGKPKRKMEDANIPSGYGDLFVKIAAVCRIDPKIPKHAKQISNAAKYLANRNVTPDRIDAFSAWWRKNDFRGQRGEYTLPNYIAELWLQFEESQNAAASAPHDMRNRYAAPQMSKTGTVRRAQAFFSPEQRAKSEGDALRALEEDEF